MTSTLKGITLKGSAELVAEFFSFGINSILYQRGIYPPETFSRATNYDMSLQLTTDPKLKNYLSNVVSQLKEWLFECTVQKLVLVITCLETNEVLERWQFDIECDKSAKESSAPREKSIKTIQDEIRSVIRQITATVTFLPLLETPCALTSSSTQTKTWWFPTSGRSLGRRSSTNRRRCVCAPSPPPSTR
ncbi:mitotic spindle assembly checkpoint protein MAD2A isoform X1 [Etheostoma spectabile]|uniref:mitotic spindle assembly checkpoint protein MAD2A isoform X1 n=1 Tax=Etheostoma spectabile TaxID=54343 RepID=UPI0013AEB0F9|nr:mitotic spindle assembly checkpoint protein MAD2A isoform X1 [Etheostoma spectabile]